MNPAQIGNGIGSRIPGMMTAVAVRTMGSLVSKSMANAKGGNGGKTGRNGNTGRGGSASRPGGNPRPNNPVSGGVYGGSSVNNTGTTTSVNGGTHINGSGSSTNIGGSTANTEKQTGQAVRDNTNVMKPNVSGAVKNGGTMVNQGVQNSGQQGAVHESVQNKGNVQRPPIPKNTAGSYPRGTVNDTELINRHEHVSALVQNYEDTIAEQPEGVNPDIYWLISIESVRSKQELDEISKWDIEKSVENSYTIDEETDEVHNKTPDEMMNDLGFDDEQKNRANLMYDTLNYQYIDPEQRICRY